MLSLTSSHSFKIPKIKKEKAEEKQTITISNNTLVPLDRETHLTSSGRNKSTAPPQAFLFVLLPHLLFSSLAIVVSHFLSLV
ncbi:hypothetical protein RJT34_18200 [Clitoria ternatea]|uniref:Transmembrane protein n=1 Tax=Clitoria ternatea TaxID=43366 RepID=A0AAN9PF76_CLITE